MFFPPLPSTARPPTIMDLDVGGVQGSLDQLGLGVAGGKPQLSSRTRQRLSVKSRKKLPLAVASLVEQTEERGGGGEGGGAKVLSTRSVSPPASREERGSERQDISRGRAPGENNLNTF